jgi:hypothetical protein
VSCQYSELAQKDYAEKTRLVTAKVPFKHIHSADIAEEVTDIPISLSAQTP